MTTNQELERKIQARLLLAPRVEGDQLVLTDAVLLAALEGRRALNASERQALASSPLTLRRFRRLATERQRACESDWAGSRGMLRAAAGGALDTLSTDDGLWTLHFVAHGALWRVILVLDAGAPLAARLLRDRAPLRVVDGAGGVILHGTLDSDGEYECAWPFAEAPAPHFLSCGGSFMVQPAW